MRGAKRRRISEKVACSLPFALPSELVEQLVSPYLEGCDLAEYACLAKEFPEMTLKGRVMATIGQASEAASLWTARL